MVTRIRIHLKGKGKTLRYAFKSKPTPKQVMDLVYKEYPDWSVIGWCEDDLVTDNIHSWVRKHYPEVDVTLVKIDDNQATLNGVPFAFVYLEGEVVRFYFYNYNFIWAINHEQSLPTLSSSR